LKTVLPIDAGDSASALEISDQAIAFLIDFRRNVMRNSPSRMTETHATVKSDCTQPVRLSRISYCRHLPKTHMMTPAGIITYRLLKGEVLSAAKEHQVTDRRIIVRTMKNRALRDVQTAPQSDRICGIPPSRKHCRGKVALASNE